MLLSGSLFLLLDRLNGCFFCVRVIDGAVSALWLGTKDMLFLSCLTRKGGNLSVEKHMGSAGCLSQL